MKKSALLVTSLLIVASIHASTQERPGAVQSEERAILMDLFAATGGPRWTHQDGWGSEGSVCDWYGVACDFVGGDIRRPFVAALMLSSNNLEGTLPDNLSQLEQLRHLDVAENHLSGSIPARLLERWDAYQFEFDGSANAFREFVVRVVVDYSSSGGLCAELSDNRFRVEFDEPRNRAVFQSERCAAAAPSSETYCLVREGRSPSLERFSRGLRSVDFTHLGANYDYAFSGATHGLFLTTTAVWGDGTEKSVESYDRQGPLKVWEAQQMFLGLLSDAVWEREWRKPKCDFER